MKGPRGFQGLAPDGLGPLSDSNDDFGDLSDESRIPEMKEESVGKGG